MSAILELLAGSWHWLAAIAALIAAGFSAYLGGKKAAKAEEKAKADVAEAIRVQNQAEAKSDVEAHNIQTAKEVQQSNASVSDDSARERMRRSKYNSPD
ncbi:hypothetical protein ACP3S8_00130 [Mixta calida]|uniref:hypothetical protein n=1 Tax=Mixta calida TaxID=665913 RepID=UPI003CF064E0